MRGGRRNRPAVVLDNQQNRKLVDRRLTEENIEIIRSRAAIPGRKGNNLLALMPLQREADAASERSQRPYFAEGRQNTLLSTAIVRRHIASRAHWSGCA